LSAVPGLHAKMFAFDFRYDPHIKICKDYRGLEFVTMNPGGNLCISEEHAAFTFYCEGEY